jgi:hypothetical protein
MPIQKPIERQNIVASSQQISFRKAKVKDFVDLRFVEELKKRFYRPALRSKEDEQVLTEFTSAFRR